MKNTMILVSGVPATGKTTFATWLASEIGVPLLCRDHVFEKYTEISKSKFENLLLGDEEQYLTRLWEASSGLYWFLCEEIMKSSSPLIIESSFGNDVKEIINDLIEKYKYHTVNVHLDAPLETICRRFSERSYKNGGNEIPLDDLKIVLQDGKIKSASDFRYGDYIIHVDTTDFSMVSYEDIAEQIRQYTLRAN